MFFIPFLILAADQLTKRLAFFWYYKDDLYIFDYMFFSISNFTIFNKGISFGMLSQSCHIISIYYAIGFSLIFVGFKWYKAKTIYEGIAWGLIVGGGASNAIDRLLFGNVLDFILIKLWDLHSPVFNIADLAIVIGAAMLLGAMIKLKKNESK